MSGLEDSFHTKIGKIEDQTLGLAEVTDQLRAQISNEISSVV